jgi:succinate dehydrogenase / fumarate reductase cytochrome b subunit
VTHLLWLIARGEGLERLKEVAVKKLGGLRVAPFYGCQLLRPSALMGFEDPDRPSSLEAVIEVCGGEPVDYPAKTLCCGFPILLAREKTSLAELKRPLEQAREAGAEAMVTSCPLCHLSLDGWQRSVERARGKKLGMPIFHLSQLVALAAGLEPARLGLSRHVVPLSSVLARLDSPLKGER